MGTSLSPELEKKGNAIAAKFAEIEDDWKKYSDEIIPEDKEFAVEICDFLIEWVEYLIDNFDEIDIRAQGDILKHYEIGFLYGREGDDRTSS